MPAIFSTCCFAAAKVANSLVVCQHSTYLFIQASVELAKTNFHIFMNGAFAQSECLGCSTYSCVLFNNIRCNLQCAFFQIILHIWPPVAVCLSLCRGSGNYVHCDEVYNRKKQNCNCFKMFSKTFIKREEKALYIRFITAEITFLIRNSRFYFGKNGIFYEIVSFF